MARCCLLFNASTFIILLIWAVDEAFAGAVELQRSWRADAALHDVQMVGPRQCWAVGDHGALWQTTDAGRTWSLIETGTMASLRSVCALTDQVGWIAGWQVRGSAELTEAVLLATRDGGQSWQSLEIGPLSPLRCVRFFGLQEGLVVGEPTRDNPTGLWTTNDGGKSWQAVEGRPSRGFHSVHVASLDSGLLADRDGNISLLAGGQLLPSRLPALQGRSVRGVALSGSDEGWLAGDGGLLLNSKSGGVVWEPPAGDLPDDLRHVSDFRAVAVKDGSVWIAGDPGGVIWHSPDGGRRWTAQFTGNAIPVNRLHFATKSQGVAVGELGTILITDDGGKTWTAAQGGGRHAAALSIHSRVANLSPELLTKISGEQGYRSAAWVATRAEETSGPLSASDRFSQAVTLSGGSAGILSWQLPLEIDGLDLSSEKLLEHWKRRTEGQLQQALVGRIVRQIRVWRPQVLIVDQPAPEDAAGQIILDATLHAIEQAGDATRYVVHRELGGLGPWKVERVYLQLLPGSTGEISLDPFEFLPRWQSNARMASTASRTLLAFDAALIARANFRPHAVGKPDAKLSKGSDFFSGLSLAPGSDVRRDLTRIDDRQLDQQIKSVQKHRNYVAQAERSFDNPQAANAMLAQLRELTTEMSTDQAALTLYDLFEQYRRRGQYDLAEATGQELIRKFPDQSVSADVARWILQSMTSEEATWQRIQQLKHNRQTKPGASPSLVRQVGHQAQLTHLPELKDRLKKGQQAVLYLESRWPRLAASEDVQFPLAALCRTRGSHNQADAIYRQWAGATEEQDGRAWSGVVRREIWLTQQSEEIPPGILRCRRATSRPQLDGLLSDDCWQEAAEVLLEHRRPATMSENAPLVMLAYDDEFLYLAASVPRIDGQSTAPPKLAGRGHDADLRRHDRLTFLLDLDRDYSTWYEFQVDQRGWTAESCWENAAWNPQWFVAAEGESAHWRVEMAIPFSELTAKRPQPGSAWAIHLERTAPAAGRQTWIPTHSSQPVGSTLGLLRFE